MLQQKHRNWSSIDYQIYEIFNTSFHKRLANVGTRFHQDLKFLKQVKQRLVEYCEPVYKVLAANTSQIYTLIDRSPPLRLTSDYDPTETVEINPLLCALTRLRVEAFENIFRVRMYPGLCNRYRNNVSPPWQVGMWAFSPYTFNPAFCSERKSKYNIPWKILGIKDSYRFD